MAQATQRELARLHPFVALSIVLHIGVAWSFMEQVTITPIDPGESEVLSVRVLAALAPALPAQAPKVAAPSPKTPETVARPMPTPLAERVPQSVDPVSDPMVVEAEPGLPNAPQVAPVLHEHIDTETASAAPLVAAASRVDAAPDRGTRNDEEAQYLAEVRSRILAQKRYPSLARRRSIVGLVVARLEIQPDGSLRSVQTSAEAHKILTRATAAAIRRAAPFPAPPDGVDSIEIVVDYELSGSSF